MSSGTERRKVHSFYINKITITKPVEDLKHGSNTENNETLKDLC